MFADEVEAWDFVCYCVEQILTTEFSDARAQASGLDFRDSNLSKRMLWVSVGNLISSMLNSSDVNKTLEGIC